MDDMSKKKRKIRSFVRQRQQQQQQQQKRCKKKKSAFVWDFFFKSNALLVVYCIHIYVYTCARIRFGMFAGIPPSHSYIAVFFFSFIFFYFFLFFFARLLFFSLEWRTLTASSARSDAIAATDHTSNHPNRNLKDRIRISI